ncbi:hypothetical protein BH11ARM1_BH11ARM1_02460 [soil metagenome]
MRRFIKSLPGKVVSNLIVLALLLPSISLVLASRAEAQVAVLPTWAVVQYKNLKSPGTNFGQVAADAVSSELLKTNMYEVVSQETINIAVKSLGISVPTEGTTLMRLAGQVRASTVVTGEVANYQVMNTGGGKMARVTLRTVVYDVASAVAVNGNITTADSTTRSGDVSDETLITDAIQSASSDAIRQIQAQTLPTGTILNTTTAEALINKGARSGFKEGQEVIILRNREQVASGHVRSVDPDMSTVRVERVMKGVQPGDKVRAIFSVPGLVIQADGSAKPAAKKSSGISSTLITALLVVGLLALLIGGGGGGDSSVVSSVTAEATLDEAFQPAIQVSWSPNGFAKGNANRVQWQIWRSDVQDSPVLTAAGILTSTLDRTTVRSFQFTKFNVIGGTQCLQTDYNNTNANAVPGVRAGRPYIYGVELIYALSSLDLPGGSSGSGSTSTGTTASTSTGTTASTSTGTTASTSTGTTASTSTGTTASTASTASTSGLDGVSHDALLDSDRDLLSLDAAMPVQQSTSSTSTSSSSTSSTSSGSTSTGGGTVTTCYFQSPPATARGSATALIRPTTVAPTQGQAISGPFQFRFNSAVQTTPILVEYTLQFSDSILFPQNRT